MSMIPKSDSSTSGPVLFSFGEGRGHVFTFLYLYPRWEAPALSPHPSTAVALGAFEQRTGVWNPSYP